MAALLGRVGKFYLFLTVRAELFGEVSSGQLAAVYDPGTAQFPLCRLFLSFVALLSPQSDFRYSTRWCCCSAVRPRVRTRL